MKFSEVYAVFLLQLDYFLSESIMQKILLSFSFATNGAKLLNTRDTREGTIKILHGIRFYSTLSIIMGHAFAMALKILPLRK